MNLYLTIFFFFIPILFFITRGRRSSKKLPPGSLGIPFIGQSLSLLRAMRTNTAEEWLQQRVKKFGPVSKLTLFGKPTVFIHGQAANKLIFTGDESIISNQQVESLKKILGARNLTELSGDDHKRVRGALVSFLRPESLRKYVGKMDEEIRRHLKMHWQGRREVTVLPLMKTLTFDIICSLLFGVEHGTRRKGMRACFETMIEGIWSVPINLPFTRYTRSLQAAARVQDMLKQLLKEKRKQLEEKDALPHQDLITCLLSSKNKENKEVFTEDEIVHNIKTLMIAGHDTTSILLTFMVRLFANNPTVYAAVLQEHEEIARSKECEELLTWEDIGKMKYTWRVALETLRLFPPVFGMFRKALKDIEFGGYIIPKGWQIFWAVPMTHMDDAIFPEPLKFEPSRFENQMSIPPFCFTAFGGGARICPGNEFAKLETLVTIHYLVTRYTWKLSSEDFFIRDPALTPNKGLPIQLYAKETSSTL